MFTNRAYKDTNSIYKIMVGMRVFTGDKGTDNVSGERAKHRAYASLVQNHVVYC